MNCADAREAMLVADVEELGVAASETLLAQHLKGCEECRRLATSLTSATTAIGAVRRRRTRRIGRTMLALVPIAAAIVAAIVLRSGSSKPAVATPSHFAERPDSIVSVHVQQGQRATVIKTSDPTVTIVWLLNGD